MPLLPSMLVRSFSREDHFSLTRLQSSGLQDQRLKLQWLQANIAQFGAFSLPLHRALR